MFVIFGATGNTGGVLASQLLAKGKKVRAVGRSRDKLGALQKAGAEIAVADLENTEAVAEALKGADAAYLLIPPNMIADDFRGYQKRVVEAVGRAVEGSSLKHVVLLSSMGAEHASGTGPIVGLYEFEQRLKRIAKLNVLAIRAGYFMPNLLANIGLMKGQGINGSPAPGSVPFTLIHPSDIGAYAAQRLERLDFTGHSAINLIGPKLVSMDEATAALGKAVGKTFPYVQFPLEAAEAGMVQAGLKPQMAALYAEMYKGAMEGKLGPEAGTSMANGTTSIETFAEREFAPAFRAS